MIEWFKGVFLKVATFVAFVAGFFYFFFKRPAPGPTQDQKKFEEQNAETKTKQAKADELAGDSVARYDAIREEYLRNRGDEP